MYRYKLGYILCEFILYINLISSVFLWKGKSASQKPTKGSQKVLKEKAKTLKKANSMGDMKKKISKAVPADESEKENQPKKKTKK